MGADGVELDVRRGLLVHHDLEPMPDSPTLAAALDACVGMTVNVEIKNLPGEADFDVHETVASDVVTLLHERDGRDVVLVSSFNIAAVDRVRALDESIPTGFLVTIPPDDDVAGRTIDTCRRHGHVAIHPHHFGVTPRLVELAHAAGLSVNTWTVDDPDRMRELAAMGVDVIMTNVPDLARAVLGT